VNPDQVEVLDRALRDQGSNAGCIQIIRRWIDFVEELAEPYALTIYDYDDEVNGRITLAAALRTLSDELAGSIGRNIAEADRKFFDRTTPCRRWDREGFEAEWLNRAPILRGEEISNDLATECP
jgi:hypothetical protein